MTLVAPPNFRVIAGSVQGTSHLRTRTPCQDAYHFTEIASGELIVALSDGAGSAAYGEEGAQHAVATAVATVAAALDRYRPTTRRAWHVTVQSAFLAAQQAIFALAAQRERAPRDFAATLLLLIFTAEETIGGLVGDCVAVLHHDGTLLSLCPPQRGEYANTTNFVTQPDLRSQIDVRQWAKPVRSAALFSDGLAPLAMNLAQNEPFAPFFEPLFAFLAAANDAAVAGEQLADFLSSDRVNARTDDDKTLVLIQRIAHDNVPTIHATCNDCH
ncbi:MAG TPA: PP2C family serine/threonine-protein phosphatase [Caldilineaceae bacterium]|nr:PP2C family serine/threonine-protein phosphatase [Caldilineaceae bacterium]